MFNFELLGKTHSNTTAAQGAVAGIKQSLCMICDSRRVLLVIKKLFHPPDWLI